MAEIMDMDLAEILFRIPGASRHPGKVIRSQVLWMLYVEVVRYSASI